MSNYIFSLIFLYLIVGLGLFFIQRKITFNKSGRPKKPFEYGLYNINETVDETIHENDQSNPNTPYGISKLTQTRFAKFYNENELFHYKN